MIKWKQFESLDDDDLDLARMEMSQCDGFISFYFRSLLIRNEKEIKYLIDLYKKTKEKNKEWSGGPVNREFDNYFIGKYKPSLSRVWDQNPSKPSIGLTLETDYGFFHSSFTIKDHIPYSHISKPFDNKKLFNQNIIDIFRVEVVDSESDIIWNTSKIWSKSCKKYSLEEIIDHFNIKTNYFDIFN
jgi:hypothetical protein